MAQAVQQTELDRELLDAVENQDVDRVRSALAQGGDPNADPPGRDLDESIAEWAVRISTGEVVDALVDGNATFRLEGAFPDTAFFLAIKAYNPGTLAALDRAAGSSLKSLIARRVIVSRESGSNVWDENPLMIARHSPGCAQHLIDSGMELSDEAAARLISNYLVRRDESREGTAILLRSIDLDRWLRVPLRAFDPQLLSIKQTPLMAAGFSGNRLAVDIFLEKNERRAPSTQSALQTQDCVGRTAADLARFRLQETGERRYFDVADRLSSLQAEEQALDSEPRLLSESGRTSSPGL